MVHMVGLFRDPQRKAPNYTCTGILGREFLHTPVQRVRSVQLVPAQRNTAASYLKLQIRKVETIARIREYFPLYIDYRTIN